MDKPQDSGSVRIRGIRTVPRGVWALGFVSMFMDTSSELVHSLLPIFLVSILGASTITLGIIEGIAEATAMVAKVFSGTLSDYLGARKSLTVVGYGLSALTKPLFPLADAVSWVFAARFIDRIGKGIRGAPRDALVADLTPPHARGAAYGLRQALDTVGAFAGPLAAVALMAVFSDNIRLVLWFAVVPAIVAVGFLIFGVQEPVRPARVGNGGRRLRFADAKRLRFAFWWVAAVGGILTLARFSEAFLLLRAQTVGVAVGLVPLVFVVMNVAYAAVSYPAGAAADRINRRSILGLGLGVLVAADIVLAFANGALWVFAGVALWGVHMGLTQGLLAALVADSAPEDLRGTAFGLFNLVSGAALLLASVIAGGLWEWVGPTATFLAGAAFTILALISLVLGPNPKPSGGG